MQPRYITFTSTGVSNWQTVNWDATPQEIAFAVITTSGSSFAISVTYEDPSGTYPSPNSSAPTAFNLLTGSSQQFVTVGASMKPIAGFQCAFNVSSGAGNRCTFVYLQSGIG